MSTAMMPPNEVTQISNKPGTPSNQANKAVPSVDDERESLLFMAKLAEQTSRVEESADYMTRLIRLGKPLTDDERNLFSVAFKNLLTGPRNAWRLFASNEARELSFGNQRHAALIQTYKEKIEQELHRVCNQMITLLDDVLIPTADSVQCSVFYWKMKGDYLRYMAEYTVPDSQQHSQVVSLSQQAYEKASELASTLPATNIVRLGLALNFSVFYYEIKGMPQEASRIAQESYHHASMELKNEQFENASYKDITIILQLFQDNLTLWHGEHNVMENDAAGLIAEEDEEDDEEEEEDANDEE